MRCPTLEALPPPPPGRTGWPWTEESPQLPDTMPDGSPWPSVSIVTPSLNQAGFIEETIRSVLLQGYPNLEYVLMDGRSTDGTLEIIKAYEAWLSSWASETDRGQADAINKGFRQSTGEIMGWLNSDDTYTRNAMACIVRQFTDHPQTNILYGEAWYIQENGHRLSPCRYVTEAIPRSHLLSVDPIVQPSTFWRRRLWLAVGELDSDLTWGFDWEFFLRAHLEGGMHYVPEFLANYRLHDTMKTRSGGEARHAELASISRRYGGWGQPTNVVYQAARPRYLISRLTLTWPRPIRKLLDLVVGVPHVILKRFYAQRFMH